MPSACDVTVPDRLTQELTTTALRRALWLALFMAQRLGRHDLAHRLTAELCAVDELIAGNDAVGGHED